MAHEDRPLPWMEGVSLGTITGALKPVPGARDELKVVILPPVGPKEVECEFAENLREDVGRNLSRYVRVTGMFHYADKSPHPYLVDIEKIETLPEDNDMPHLKDGFGLFAGSHYESKNRDPF